MKKRLARHALDLRVAFPVLQFALSLMLRDEPERDHDDFRGFILKGEIPANVMLAGAHGQSVTQPALGTVREWQEEARVMIRGVRVTEPQWFDHHLRSLPFEAQRLLRSM